MKGSRCLILLVALAVAAVVIAKGAARRHADPQPEVTAPPSTAQPATGSGALAQKQPGESLPGPKADVQPKASQATPPPAAPPLSPKSAGPAKPEPLAGSQLADALQSGLPTMADFGAGWCKSCQMMEPVLRQAAATYAGKANIVYVNTELYPDTAHEYRIRLIPTQIFFDSQGRALSRHIGYWALAEVEAELTKAGVAR